MITDYGKYDLANDFTPEALKYLLDQIFELIPDHRQQYAHFYNEMQGNLRKYAGTTRWDFYRYFNEKFPKP